MKRLILFIFMAATAGGLLFAQSRNWPGFGQRTASEQSAVSGALGIAKGQIAVEDGGKTYYLMGLDRYIGFIDGLKEGASVEVEGYTMQTGNRTSNNESYLRVTKLTMNGKSYDLDTGFRDLSGLGGILQFSWNNLPRLNNRMMPQAPQFRQQRQTNSRRR